MLAKKSDADKFTYYSFNLTVRLPGSGSQFQDSTLSKVEVRGLEPLTPWLQTMCSAN